MAAKKRKPAVAPAQDFQIPEMTGAEAQAAAAMALGQPATAEAATSQPEEAGGPAAKTVAGRRKFVNSNQWEAFVESRYPGLLQIYRDNPEVATIIRNGYILDQPADEITTNLVSTKWYTSLGAGEYEYIVKTTTGDKAYADKIAARENLVSDGAKNAGYTLSDAAIKKIAADSLKSNWGQPDINDAIGKAIVGEAGKQTQTAPSPTTPTALQQGADAASLRNMARKYGLTLSDADVEGYVQASLRGDMTTQQITDVFRNQAKSLYPSFAKQLDAGDLDAATGTYKSIASQVLGVDPTQVDLSTDKYKKLLTYKDPDSGESRPMNSTEWGNYLRTLPEWKKTAEASNRYRDLINTIDDLFGKVR